MTIRRLFMLFLIVVSASALSANGGAPDNKGTDFFLAFPQNVPGAGQKLFLFLAAEDITNVEISGPELGGTTTFPIPSPGTDSFVLGVEFSNTTPQVSTVNNVGKEGILVRSVDPLDPTKPGAPIAVYAFNRQPPTSSLSGASTAAYVALPVDVLGTEYRALARPVTSQVTIVGTEDNTSVTITTPFAILGVTTGVAPFQVVRTLNRLETFLLQPPTANLGDLTGTLVMANKPVAVFSGNQNGTVNGSSSRDHMVEQMVPVNTWGDEFVIAPIAPKTDGDIIRVLAHKDNTVVDVNGVETIVQAGKYHEFAQPSSSGSWVSASEPVLVAQYNKGDASTHPFMMLVPPVKQFSRQYLFKTPGAPFSNWLNIVTKAADEVNLRLNNAALPDGTVWTAVNGYRYARVPLAAGADQRLEHQEPSVRFGAWVYGHGATNISRPLVPPLEGYGYAAGQLVNSPPICSEAVASTPLIGPPNHQLVSIGVNGVIDPDNDDVIIEIATIRQDEPTNDTGDGNTAIDGFGIGTSVAQVRAERSGGGNGRVYHIGFTATDPWGGSCSGEVTVGVPHSQGRAQRGGSVDDGALYDSTAP